jgi:hypothetical protein
MRRRSLSVFLFAFLISVLLINVNVIAQIRADANAPSDQRPTILQTGNAIPLVNIQTPTAAGVSTPTANSMSTETASFSTTVVPTHKPNSVVGFRAIRGWPRAVPASS